MEPTQLERVLSALKSGNWVSTVDAVTGRLGTPILRLGARIDNIKKMGYEVESRAVEGKSYHEYRLTKKAEQANLW